MFEEMPVSGKLLRHVLHRFRRIFSQLPLGLHALKKIEELECAVGKKLPDKKASFVATGCSANLREKRIRTILMVEDPSDKRRVIVAIVTKMILRF
jgi:hypothetical protein